MNGQILPLEDTNINATDLSILRGYGVFDFFRAIDSRPVFMEDHLDRFENSAHLIGIKVPASREDLRQGILEIIRLNQQPLLGIRLVCTGGYSIDGYTPSENANLIMVSKPFVMQPFELGLRLMTVFHQRDMPKIKSINYIKPISLLSEMNKYGADDVLYHSSGIISESSRSNIFIIKNGILITPKNGILLGITRKYILSFANEIMPVEIRNITLHEVYEADEVFVTASTKRIKPVIQIDKNQFEIGPYSRKLYDKMLDAEKTLG
ncbi:MAG: aminotransferase class IV family protein [Saprospiraceae bacterium]|nr:aminotransferase class IV family protein [Saprospiraceae bacterium]